MKKRCYNCAYWQEKDGKIERTAKQWETENKDWEQECRQLKHEVDIDLDAHAYGGGDTVGDIWTYPNWFCAGWKKLEV